METRTLNQAVKRNLQRFPEDFMFQMTSDELENWKSQIVISNKEKMGADIIIPDEVIMSKIIPIRGQKVMISNDLTDLYGVTNKRLNEYVKRNIKRFSIDFMLQLTEKKKDKVVANCDHLQHIKYSSY